MNNDQMHTSGQTVLVHKANHEGAIQIDPVTGYVLTPQDDRPEWASELTIAQTTERHLFYTDRLRGLYTAERSHPEVMAFEDLAWFGVREYPADAPYINTETNEAEYSELYTVSADEEFRTNQLMEAMTLTSELDAEGNETGSIYGAEVEVAIAEDNLRSAEELAELEADQKQGMQAVGQ